MQKLIAEQDSRNDRKSNIFISVLVLLVLVLAVVRVVIANVSVEASEKLKNLDQKISALETENQLKAEKLRAKESLVYLEVKAKAQGFTKTDDYSFIVF